MSFILDALKKSETERQQQSGAEFSSIPSSSGNPQSFKWIWILGLLLLVNVVVLVGILMRPKAADTEIQAPVSAPASVPIESAPVDSESFEEKIAAAKQKQPAPPDEIDTNLNVAQPTARPAAARNRARVLTIDEVRVNGSLQMTDLHLDIHVYSEVPAERFVFINMTKYREQSRLEEGPRVLEITAEGVILEHEGITFLLPRE
jgi:general secretion pathway protein B